MKAINIELDKSQFLRIINQLDYNDKLELYKITKEVESVREKRYEEGKQII